MVGLFFGTALAVAIESSNTPSFYLTWQRDPATTMTVQWLSADTEPARLSFRKRGEADWSNAFGETHPMPGSDRVVHWVELTRLASGCEYEFGLAPEAGVFRFRTMPKDLSLPVRFIEGGDVYHQRKWMDNMNELAGKFDPAFVVFGGDLAYARQRENIPEKVERWYDFFDSWFNKARTPDGRLIPMLVTIGNHEATGFWGQPAENAAGYYALFAMPGSRGYNCLDFGNYLTILLLDSGITHPIEGAQARWLRDQLARRSSVPHVFPIYHIPAWPSVRPESGGENGEYSEAVRREWCPLFERYGVRLSFEHHDHDFKRSFPLRNGKIDEKRGVVYVGDGAWGVVLREPDVQHPRWYIVKERAVRHFYVVTLYSDARHALAVDERGQIFDELYQPVRR